MMRITKRRVILVVVFLALVYAMCICFSDFIYSIKVPDYDQWVSSINLGNYILIYPSQSQLKYRYY